MAANEKKEQKGGRMTRSKMYLRMVTASFARRKSRMIVALLAVTVGATILAGLVMVYYDMPRQMSEQFLAYGANMIFVPSEGSDGMTSQQVADAEAQVEGDVRGVISYSYKSCTINDSPVVIAGCDLAETLETSPFWQIDGSLPDEPGEILVGLEQADFFSLKVGDTVTVSYLPSDAQAVQEGENLRGDIEGERTKEFTVTGLLDTGSTEEQYLYVSEEDMADLIGVSADDLTYDVTELRVSADEDALQDSVQQVKDNVPGVTAQLVKRITQSQTTVLSKLSALVLLVTIITLALTMICVATTMTAVVTERRREIGLRKALGASDQSIMWEFMGEGLLLGLIGGLAGSFLGFGFAWLVSTNVFNSTIDFMPALVPLTVVVSLLVVALACAIPVRNTMKVDPALVLKGE